MNVEAHFHLGGYDNTHSPANVAVEATWKILFFVINDKPVAIE